MVNNMPPEVRGPALSGAMYPGNPPETGEVGEPGSATPVLPVLPLFGVTVQDAGNLLEAPYPDDNPIEGPEQPGARERNYGRWAFGGTHENLSSGQNTHNTSALFARPNRHRRKLFVQNLSNTDPLWIQPSADGNQAAVSNQPSICLNPAPGAGQGGGTWVEEGTVVTTDGWQFLFPTHDNQSFTAYEV